MFSLPRTSNPIKQGLGNAWPKMRKHSDLQSRAEIHQKDPQNRIFCIFGVFLPYSASGVVFLFSGGPSFFPRQGKMHFRQVGPGPCLPPHVHMSCHVFFLGGGGSFFYLQLELFCLQLSFFAPIVSKEAPTVSQKTKIVSRKAPIVSKKAKIVNCK